MQRVNRVDGRVKQEGKTEVERGQPLALMELPQIDSISASQSSLSEPYLVLPPMPVRRVSLAFTTWIKYPKLPRFHLEG